MKDWITYEIYWIEKPGFIALQDLIIPCFSDVPYNINLLSTSAKIIFLALAKNVLTSLFQSNGKAEMVWLIYSQD